MTEDTQTLAVDRPDVVRSQRATKSLIGSLLAALILFVVLSLPNDHTRISLDTITSIPLELPLLVLLLSAVPRRAVGPVRFVAVALVALVAVIKLADMAALEALSRPFNPVLDMHLLGAGWNLLSGAVGQAGAAGIVVLLLVAVGLTVIFVAAAVKALVNGTRRHRRLAAGAALAALALGFLTPLPASFFSAELLARRAQSSLASLDDLETFRAAARNDPVAAVADEALFSRLAGKDVLLAFVESYGRTVLDNPRYSGEVLPVLERFDAMVEREGLTAASGFLTSPVAGGQSWLAHASLLSGLWVDSQQRYNALIASRRATLIDDFNRAGWRSVAVMPAITMAWPEGERLGYDAIYDADGLGYEGLPFNWVTMPDQYTLSAFDRLEREQQRDRPVFAEIALISSHAPWTPVPEIVPWDAVGDGELFNEQALSGDTPQEVWSDIERVKTQYRLSIEYALANLASYVEERLDGDYVLVILGDHQPSRRMTDGSKNSDVPFHLISNDPEAVRQFGRAWPMTPGMIPDPSLPSARMDAFRQRFVSAFSAPEDGDPAQGLGPT